MDILRGYDLKNLGVRDQKWARLTITRVKVNGTLLNCTTMCHTSKEDLDRFLGL